MNDEHMKTIYFVRHGESETNAGAINKGFHAQLTEKGRQQAHLIAERCARLPAQIIIASTMPRAADTASIIAARTSLLIDYSELFVERRRPSIQVGMQKESLEYEKINHLIYENFLHTGARYTDEENFEDLAERSSRALEYLLDRPESELLVATHGIFLRMLAARALLGEDLTGPLALKFMRTLRCKNTGLTIFKHGAEKAFAPWEIVTWNDHAHLG